MGFWDWLERSLETRDDRLPKKVDVAIAVGIDVSKDGTKASPQSRAVALKAAELFLRGKAENVLSVGGYSAGGPIEAEAMADIIADNIPETNLFLEKKSFRTYLNADYTLLILKQNGWKTAIIVAQQWHARRVRVTFRKRWQGSGIKFFVVKAQSPYGGGSQKRLNHFWSFVLWDIYAFIVSKIKGYC